MTRRSQLQNALYEITQGALRFKQSLGPTSAVPPASRQTLSSHHYLTLPLPQPITSSLSARGLGHSIALKLNQAYLDQASSLKQLYEDKQREVITQCLEDSLYIHDLDQFASATHSAYVTLYDQSLRDWRVKIDEICRDRSSPILDRPHHTTKEGEKRSLFKNENVPILDKAFNINAYPSREDKEGLAQETGMEYKQINIWFQNRRARSKREGASLQRFATFATQLRAPKSAPASPTAENPSVNSCEQRLTYSSEIQAHSSRGSPQQVNFSTLNPRPTHVFPTPYPPFYDEDPFPVRSGGGSFQTVWLRQCTTDTIQKSEVDIEQLTAQLASLSLSSDETSGSRSPLPSFALVLPRAPLPALIRTATGPSRAHPVATRVSAASASPGSSPREFRNMYRALPRLSVARPLSPRPLSPTSNTRPTSIPYWRASARRRSRRSETRSPSPSHSSRSSSSSSIASSRSTSSSWSVASSVGPLTPTSSSPRIEALALPKETVPTPPLRHKHQSSSIVDGHIFQTS